MTPALERAIVVETSGELTTWLRVVTILSFGVDVHNLPPVYLDGGVIF
jgi:hypothetical protein